jgi:hypothetical protein
LLRKIAVLAIGVAALMLVGTASGSPPLHGTTTVTTVSDVFGSPRQADGNTFITDLSTNALSGALTGTSISTFYFVFHADGSGEVHGTGTFTGTFAEVGTVSVPFYGATSALPGYTQQNRPDYHQRYLGFELSATKRMSNRWMGRFGFASTSWNEYFDGPNAILDKTPTREASGQFSPFQSAGPLVNGGPVVLRSSGSGKSAIFLLPPKYQLTANGLYQGPWGIDLGANLVFRQGYGEPFYRSRVNARDPVIPNKNLLLASGADQFRLDPVTSFDARVEKMFKFGTTSFAVDFDIFNLFNNATVLGKQYDARVTTYDTIQEIMNPRIARLGVRFFF